MQLSTDAVSTLGKVWILTRVWKQHLGKKKKKVPSQFTLFCFYLWWSKQSGRLWKKHTKQSELSATNLAPFTHQTDLWHKQLWQWLEEACNQLWQWLEENSNQIWQWLVERCNQIWQWLVERCNQIWQWLVERCNQIWQWLVERCNQIWQWLGEGCNQLGWGVGVCVTSYGSVWGRM